MSRQVVLDTETTGLLLTEGHRIIEVGCVEIIDRKVTGRTFEARINPDRSISSGAATVHGLTDEDVVNCPRFAEIAGSLLEFIEGAELIIHNAPFDVPFLEAELSRCGREKNLASICTIVDSLVLARQIHSGQLTSLESLCRRYGVDASTRVRHGALIDARLLAQVYLAMTGGQSDLSLKGSRSSEAERIAFLQALGPGGESNLVIRATDEEMAAHRVRMKEIRATHQKVLRQRVEYLMSELRRLADSTREVDPVEVVRLLEQSQEAEQELGAILSGRAPLFD